MPRLLREIIGEVVTGYVELEIVDVETQDARGAIDAVRPDVVILAGESAGLSKIPKTHPTLRVVSLGSDGAATLYEPGAAPRLIPEVSPATLLGLLLGGA